jgi:hypothetical protein
LDKAGPISFHDEIAVTQEKSWTWSIAPDATALATASPECAIKDDIMTVTSDITRERIAALRAPRPP